ncbi:PREDICTED: uncharacterized protein LOC104598491 isoform X2 [Nelumbo nucifera]|uniref:Uncharacterized protein LOC104598491 isoform X2 n=1 Tax=Nelumbo nucifera TaxID=4432 RepID=A0A1U8AB23_NELNU|nr:PREDICTED: uncharacterized protein LOC104598491 isoform X2 [Nelumbo nucifera]
MELWDAPMDYDDNDFQNQNFQLGAEENTKFPPGLRSYALPKFDLDDSLHVHLRFDSLVETEVLLGIQGQEENQWIEEFSRGNSGIEFSSGATESCSISRHENVWSEATSSESVEMLLKSVGQDEMITGKTVIKESDACDGVGRLTSQMEPTLNQDGAAPSNIGDTIDAGPILPPDECLESFSGLSQDVVDMLPQVEIEATPQTQKCEKSDCESLRDLDPSMIGEKLTSPLSEGNLVIDKKCSDANEREDGSLVVKSKENKPQDNSATSESMQVDNLFISVQSLVSSVDEFNTQDNQQEAKDGSEQIITYENQDAKQELDSGKNVEDQVLSKDVHLDDQNCKGNAVATIANNLENHSSSVLDVDSTVQLKEGCSECLCSEQPVEVSKNEVVVLPKSGEIGDKIVETHDSSSMLVKGDDSLEGTAVNICDSDEGIPSSPVLEIDSLAQITEGQGPIVSSGNQEHLLEDDGHKLECGVSVCNTETSLLKVEDNKLLETEFDFSSNSHIGSPSILMAEICSSTNITHETQATEDIENGHNGLGVQCDNDTSEDHVSISVNVESSQTCRSSSVIEPSDVCNIHKDVPVIEKENERMTTGSGNNESENAGSLVMDKCIASLSHGQCTAEADVVVHVSKSDPLIGNESGDGKSSLCVGNFTCLEKREESVTETLTGPSLLVTNECSSMPSEPVSISEDEKPASCDGVGEQLPESFSQSSLSTETVGTNFHNEPEAVVADKVNQDHFGELETQPSIDDSVLKENNGAGDTRISAEKCKESFSKTTGRNPDHGQNLTQTEMPSIEVSSHNVGLKDKEEKKSNLVAGGNNDQQNILVHAKDVPVNGSEVSFKPAADFQDHPLGVGDSIPGSDECNCGSPIVISSSELTQNNKEKQEGQNGSLDQNACVSDSVEEIGCKMGSSANDLKGNDATENDRSFTFEVSAQADLPDRETDRGWRPFPCIQPYEFPQAVEGSPTTYGLSQMDPKVLQETSQGNHQASEVEDLRASSKGTPEPKSRRRSGKATDREAAKDGKSLKDPPRQTKDRGGNSCNVSSSSRGTLSQAVQGEEMRSYGYIEGSVAKPCGVPTVQTSTLPDLNNSASPSLLFLQPFTDLQQVQLRAQIFVYGSLIQGTAPDESCMVAAFGDSVLNFTDGGRSLWDNVWHASLERLHNQKCLHSNPETPLPSHLGSRVSEQSSRQSSLQSKTLCTPSRSGGKGNPSATINPAIPLSPPLWSISAPSRDGLQPSSSLLDASQAISPLHPYQSPHIRQFVGNTSPWLSQAPSAVPWIVSPPTSVLDASAHYSAFPISQPGQTSIRELSVPQTSGMQHSPLSSSVPSGGPGPLLEAKRTTVSPSKNGSADPRLRKRKKNLASEEDGSISLVAQPQTGSVSAAVVTSVATITPAVSTAKVVTANLTASSTSLTQHQIIGGQDLDQRVIFSKESCSKIEQAKQQAEEAAALAATAVRHNQSIWSQLNVQKTSGLISDVEVKLASAAVAVAAAASVAKAAAAAAKVATDAALQAKQMADEALLSRRTGHHAQTTEASFSDSVKNMGMVTPASILKCRDKIDSSSSIIFAAKEAARKRVQAASAATKRAENLDAVVKAAELAAEAVSQAGTIIAMGDPIPLAMNDLVEAGQDGHWKVQQVSSEKFSKSSNTNEGQSNLDCVGEGLDNSASHLNEQSSRKQETERVTDPGKLSSKELSRPLVENHMGLVNGVRSSEKGLGGQKGRKASESAKAIGIVSESEIGSRFGSVPFQNKDHEGNHSARSSKESSIKEGSVVEVLSDKDGFRRAWFAAKVLSLKDGQAYVCYTEVLPDEGFGQLEEWVPLEGEGDIPPRVRIAHPRTAMKFEKTRKRRRAAIVDYAWSVGDRVDAWKRDGWWEGIITEKSKEDETSLTVHFPAQGDTLVVKAWHLRPSLFWKDGQWIEWSRSREDNPYVHEGDSPQEKRPKLGRHGAETDVAVEVSGIDNTGKPEEARPLALSANEKMFTVGKSTKEGNSSDAPRTKRTGLQKEGSRVVFGVPKPGKKRKFMEVSKHYIVDKGGQTTEVNDSIKFTKYLIPQGSGPRGWKNTWKIDSAGKQASKSKPKLLKSGRTGGNNSEKDSSSMSVISVSKDGTVHGHTKASVSHDEHMSEKKNQLEHCSLSDNNKAAEDSTLFSSVARASDAPSSKKKSSSIETTLRTKGKAAPSGQKLARSEEKDAGQYDNTAKQVPDVIEPRRSNRRIQPTSRLLEGLQSSYIISKIPSAPHDKNTKTQHRSAPSSRGNNHS